MYYTKTIDDNIRRTRGLLTALNLDKRIRIAFDEWNLCEWYHPNTHSDIPGKTKEEYMYPCVDNAILSGISNELIVSLAAHSINILIIYTTSK